MNATTILSLVSILLTGLMSFLVARLNSRIEKSDKAKEAKDAARMENEALLIQLSMASLSLGEATAEAVQRNPDNLCNGEMREALEYAKTAKREYREFERRRTAESLN